MARGRKRLTAGWGLVGVGFVIAFAAVHSRRHSSSATWNITGPTGAKVSLSLHLYRGVFEVGLHTPSLPRVGFETNVVDPPTYWWTLPDPGPWPGWSTPAFRWTNMTTVQGGNRLYAIGLLLWPLVLIAFACGTPLLLSARRARKRSRTGLCPACGYDMKGLAAGAGCPECGKGTAAR